MTVHCHAVRPVDARTLPAEGFTALCGATFWGAGYIDVEHLLLTAQDGPGSGWGDYCPACLTVAKADG